MWRRRLGWGTIRAQITFGSISNPQVGEMAEWLKAHAWKAIPATLTE